MSEKWKDLNLSNAFLFAAALEDPETCQLVLEIILGRKLSKVRVHAEHSILVSSDFRSVRLDIYAADEMQVEYNIEAQNANEGNLAKRSRYHQAEVCNQFAMRIDYLLTRHLRSRFYCGCYPVMLHH